MRSIRCWNDIYNIERINNSIMYRKTIMLSSKKKKKKNGHSVILHIKQFSCGL